MIKLTCYKFPNWVFDGVNKPSASCFNHPAFSLENNLGYFNPLTPFTLNTSKVQGSFSIEFNDFDMLSFPNVLMFENDNNVKYFYQIVEVELVQQTNSTYILHLKLDVYLTYLWSIFNPNNINSSPVDLMVKRKHLNSWLYYVSNSLGQVTTLDNETLQDCEPNSLIKVYNPFLLFWINNVDSDLTALSNSYTYSANWIKTQLFQGTTGKRLMLPVMSWDKTDIDKYAWFGAAKLGDLNEKDNETFFSQVIKSNYSFNNAGQLFLYTVFKWNFTENEAKNIPNNFPCVSEDPYQNVNFLNKNILCPLSHPNFWNMITREDVGGLPQDATAGINILSLFEYFSDKYYEDILALPFAFIELNAPLSMFSLDQGALPNFYVLGMTPLANFMSVKTSGAPNLVNSLSLSSANQMWTGRYFDYDRENKNWSQTEKNWYSYSLFNEENEAVLLNERFFYSKIRLGNMEQIINWNDFKNIHLNNSSVYTTNYMYEWLFNFKILLNYPNVNIVNITQDNVVDFMNFENINYDRVSGDSNTNTTFTTKTYPFATSNNISFYENYLIGNEIQNINNPNQFMAFYQVALPKIYEKLPSNWKLDLNLNLLFNFEWRNTYPSESNNWANYQAQYHNQYELGRNLGILNMVMEGISGGMSLIPEMGASRALSGFSGDIANRSNGVNNAITHTDSQAKHLAQEMEQLSTSLANLGDTIGSVFSSLTRTARDTNTSTMYNGSSIGNFSGMTTNALSNIGYSKQNVAGAISAGGSLIGDAMKYAYTYDGGMKSDYSRLANIQGSQSMNPNILNGQWNYQEKMLSPYAQAIINQRYKNFGYKLDRYTNFYFWYNRKYWNYFSCLDFMSVYSSLKKETTQHSLPRQIVDDINSLLKAGIRIIESNALFNNGDINWEQWVNNTEIFKDNRELEYMLKEKNGN